MTRIEFLDLAVTPRVARVTFIFFVNGQVSWNRAHPLSAKLNGTSLCGHMGTKSKMVEKSPRLDSIKY